MEKKEPRRDQRWLPIERLAGAGVAKHPAVVEFHESAVLYDSFWDSMNELAERIQFGEQESMSAVIGPTGSGKTALRREFCYQFEEASKKTPANKRMKLLSMEIAAPEHGSFNWKDDFYLLGLIALREPCIHHKIDIDALERQLTAGKMQEPSWSGKMRVVDYRSAFYEALDREDVCAGLFDEAHHMRRPAAKNGVFGKYDSLKSRSNATRTHFCLLGPTELTDILFQSGQISKRVRPIWRDPFRLNRKKEMKAFLVAAKGIFKKLAGLENYKVKIDFDIEDKFSYMAERSVGVFGVLCDWVERALIRAIATSKNRISWVDMLAVQPDDAQRLGVLKDVLRYFAVRDEIKATLKDRMSFFLQPVSSSDSGTQEQPAPTPTPAPRRKSNLKPGERKPTRDKVGHE